MSLLVPVNLSNSSKMKRKPDKTTNSMMFSCDYPMSAEEVEEARQKMLSAQQSQPNESGGMAESAQANDEALRKPRAVPVNLVDPIELLEPDEYGAELGKEARVWKVYVKEADKWDVELVEGWNKSLDVILVFAALFSAISTAFLMESSKALRQDPADVSAVTLLIISQTLSAIANGSSGTPVPSPSEPSFTLPQHAVLVNTMWYLSLSLSVATSLLAMLAKEWCHSFTTNRTGHPWDQALRRQRKWAMIERWKMQELIAILPSLIHLSLLLFAAGLSIYVWDMNNTAAMPIICITSGLFAFYVWSSIMASFSKLFPYTTIFSRAVHAQSEFLQRHYEKTSGRGIKLLAWISRHSVWIPGSLAFLSYFSILLLTAILCLPLLAWDFLHSRLSEKYRGSLGRGYFRHVFSAVDHYVEDKLDDVMTPIDRACAAVSEHLRSFLTKQWHKIESDRELMTSLALKWLIQNCETPSSVAIALQAIAGAGPRIPRPPLESCNSTLHILQRLASSSHDHEGDSSANLYTRALEVLGSQKQSPQEIQEGESTDKTEMLIWDLQSEHESQIVDLIKHTEFLPSKDNLKALTLGTSATSLALRLLRAGGSLGTTAETFDSILSLLSLETELSWGKLSLAALQSLANSAILLTSCATDSLLSPTIAQEFLDKHILWLDSREDIRQSDGALDASTTVLICILLHRHHMSQGTDPQLRLQKGLGIRVERAARVLMDEHLRSHSARSKFYRVALFEILFHRDQYGLTLGTSMDLQLHLNHYTRQYQDGELILSSAALGANPAVAPGNGKTEIAEFLTSIDDVYDLVGASSSQSTVEILPAPVYSTLVVITCCTQSESERVLCEQHLARFSFLQISEFLAGTVDPVLPQIWEVYQRAEEPSAQSRRLNLTRLRQSSNSGVQAARLRHFAATQLWLLLCLVGDSSTSQQTELKETIERQTGLEIEREGVYRIKLRLGEEIVRSYAKGHHLGVYSARVAECVLQDDDPWVLREFSGISDRIEQDLEGVLPGLRGLSSFSDPGFSACTRALATELPPSPPPSIQGADEDNPEKTEDPSKVDYVTIPVLPEDT